MLELMLWVAQPMSEGYRFDRELMVYVLAGTAILCLLVFVTWVMVRLRSQSSLLLGGNLGVVELVVALAVLGTVAALALPAFITPEVVTTIIGTLIGVLAGAGRRGIDQSDTRSDNKDSASPDQQNVPN
jgi:hypothetical protein